MRRALLEVPGIELAVIAPDSNRSATARSITFREPLEVEEVEFGDGTTGFATSGTPVDCVRFAALGLIELEPELIVSGINHGANLGDDITYSGTVAAAFEGIMLGLPAIAVSQQADHGELDFRAGTSWSRRGLRASGRVRGPARRGAGGRADPGGDAAERERPGRRDPRRARLPARQADLPRPHGAHRRGGRAAPVPHLRRLARATTTRRAPTSRRSPIAASPSPPCTSTSPTRPASSSSASFDLDALLRPAAREVE